jgi:hypothetical protein
MPRVNMLHVFFGRSVDALNAQRDFIASTDGCGLFHGVRESDVPGWSLAEIYVGDGLLSLADEQVAPMFKRQMIAVRRS